MSAAAQRDHAIQIAASDPGKALAQAEEIADPWYATQAIAAVLSYCPESQISPVYRRAVATAALCPDAYRRSAVSAWVVRALAEREFIQQATDVLRAALGEALLSSPAGSRGEALLLLYQAAHPLGGRTLTPVLEELTALQRSHPHWRVSRALVDAAAMHSKVAPESFNFILRSLRDPKLSARIHRNIELGLTEPRPFFWQP